jgi:hypothetical protein
VQLLTGDMKDARQLGYDDAMRGLTMEASRVPKAVRTDYRRGFTRGEAARAKKIGQYA